MKSVGFLVVGFLVTAVILLINPLAYSQQGLFEPNDLVKKIITFSPEIDIVYMSFNIWLKARGLPLEPKCVSRKKPLVV